MPEDCIEGMPCLSEREWISISSNVIACLRWSASGDFASELLSGASVTDYDSLSPIGKAAALNAKVLLIGKGALEHIIRRVEEAVSVPYRKWTKYESHEAGRDTPDVRFCYSLCDDVQPE